MREGGVSACGGCGWVGWVRACVRGVGGWVGG